MSARRGLFDAITTKDAVFDGAWGAMSPQCVHFVRQLLIRDPTKRLTAVSAQEHPWITGNKEVAFILMIQRLMDKMYDNYKTMNQMQDGNSLQDSLSSDVRRYEEKKVSVDQRFLALRKGSVDDPISVRIPRHDAESELEGV